ncbi:MAG: segregation/condensation protein A [Actinomycetota bacterium]|nr:segregation/condensation protein A [Actinomycetota bacterium]
MAHEVKLEVFEGPIDLLLHLITRRRVDIYEVSLATITEDYLDAVAAAEDLNLDAATGFLVVAATLLELKSARLLPSPSDESVSSELLEERDLLLARLVECATYREAGMWISNELVVGERYFGREDGSRDLEELGLVERPTIASRTSEALAGVTPDMLAAVASQALAPAAERRLDVSHLAPITASVKDAIYQVAGLLSSRSPASFAYLSGGATSRIEVIVRFLALLELYKGGAVELEQAARFGDIVVSWTGEVEVSDVISDAEEYSLVPGASA